MAVLTREDYLSRLQELIGERNDDEALGILEDFTDTFDNGMSDNSEELTALRDEVENLKNENVELENTWRNKYKARFYGGSDEEANPSNQSETDGTGTAEEVPEPEDITIDDLFVEKEDE